jgi:hypothetical protein
MDIEKKRVLKMTDVYPGFSSLLSPSILCVYSGIFWITYVYKQTVNIDVNMHIKQAPEPILTFVILKYRDLQLYDYLKKNICIKTQNKMVFLNILRIKSSQEMENKIQLTQNTVQLFDTSSKMKYVAAHDSAYCHNGMAG